MTARAFTLSLAERGTATQATVDKYRDRPFSWKEGSTCIHMIRFHVVKFGHRPPAMPRVRSLAGARRALEDLGFPPDNLGLIGLMDSLFPRIAPAMMLIGDVAMLPADGGDDGDDLGALAIADGLNELIGWHALDPAGLRKVGDAHGDAVAAWRI